MNSTNSWLLEQENSVAQICIAEQQTAGKGRQGRNWVSDESGSILLSFGYELGGASAYGLSLVCGLAVLGSLENFGVSGLSLKWPNDIFLLGKKLGGILVEISSSRVVIGIGINLNLPRHLGNGIDQPWTDLNSNGYILDRDESVAGLLLEHESRLDQFLEDGFAAFAASWNTRDEFFGKSVNANYCGQAIGGCGAGVNSKGEYLVNQANGSQVAINSGEIKMANGLESRSEDTP